jgi:signal peptidase I
MRRFLTGALCLAAGAWLFPIHPAVVSGHSMDPTLHTGQWLAVDQSYYRGQNPQVGDVVLFHGQHGVYVKRVYAVGGQTVNLVEQGEGEGVERFPVMHGAERRMAAVLTGNSDARLRRVLVPEGTFFALGDALNNSEDSRDFGPVGVEKVIGRVLPLGASLDSPDNGCYDIATTSPAARKMIASR